MLQNLFISTLFYAFMLAIGQTLCFIDPIIYETIPIYTIFLILIMHFYTDNCKALEIKDFLLSAIITGICVFYYRERGLFITLDVISFIYLAIFLPFVSYASSIRYRSLM